MYLAYSDLVKKRSNLAFIIPGLYRLSGGSLLYSKTWQYESKSYSDHGIFYIDKELQAYFSAANVVTLVEWTRTKIVSYIIGGLKLVIPMHFLKVFFMHYRIIDNRVPDIVHIPIYFIHNDLLIYYLLKRYSKTKIIYTLHDPVPHLEKKGSLITRLISSYSNKRILNLASANKTRVFIHVHSSALIPEQLKTQGLNIVVHQHPLPIVKNVLNKEHPRRSKIIGFMGQIHEYKGLDIFLKAMQYLEKHPNTYDVNGLEIIIAGHGEFDALPWAQLKTKVMIKNYFLEDDEFIATMEECAGIVLPYIEATQTGVGALAISLGIPIICTDVGALSELVEKSKHLGSKIVPQNNPKSFADSIVELLLEI